MSVLDRIKNRVTDSGRRTYTRGELIDIYLKSMDRSSESEDRKTLQSLGTMLTGDPGVGKTEFVKQLALLLGIDLITIEAPHIVEETIVNVPFIVDKAKIKPSEHSEVSKNVSVQVTPNKDNPRTEEDYDIELADSYLFTLLESAKPLSDHDYIESVYSTPVLRRVYERLGGTRDKIPDKIRKARNKYRVILFIDEFFRVPSTTVGAILRNIINRQIGKHPIPSYVYVTYASNTQEQEYNTSSSISKRQNNMRFQEYRMKNPTVDEWFDYLTDKFHQDHPNIKLNSTLMEVFKDLLSDEFDKPNNKSKNKDSSIADEQDRTSTEWLSNNYKTPTGEIVRASPRRWEQLILYVNAALTPQTDSEGKKISFTEEDAKALITNVEINFRHYLTGEYHNVTDNVISAVTQLIKKITGVSISNKDRISPSEWRYIFKHQVMMKKILGDHRKYVPVLSGAPGIGKAQPLYSKIKTPTGWTTMSEVQVGDIISAADGTDTTVIGIYPQGLKPVYRFTFSDGRTAEACHEHLWKAKRFDTQDWEILTTAQIQNHINDGIKVYIPLSTNNAGYATLPKSPFEMGYEFREELQEIPSEYFSAATSQIQEFVTGLYGTTDGTDQPLVLEFDKPEIANTVQELVRSVGGWAKIEDTTVTVDFRCTELEIANVEYIGDIESQCIKIDHPDHLYVTDNFVVTHNTGNAAQVADELGLILIPIDCAALYESAEVIGLMSASKNPSGNIQIKFVASKLYREIYDKIHAGEQAKRAMLIGEYGQEAGEEKFKQFENSRWKYLIFFDEFNRAPLQVMNALRRVILEKNFADSDQHGNQYKLPKEAIVMGAINPTGEGTQELTHHMRDVVDIIPTSASWKVTKNYLLNNYAKRLKDVDPDLCQLAIEIFEFMGKVHGLKTLNEDIRPFYYDIGLGDGLYITPNHITDAFGAMVEDGQELIDEYLQDRDFGDLSTSEQETLRKYLLLAMFGAYEPLLTDSFSNTEELTEDQADHWIGLVEQQIVNSDLGSEFFVHRSQHIYKSGSLKDVLQEVLINGSDLFENNDFFNIIKSEDQTLATQSIQEAFTMDVDFMAKHREYFDIITNPVPMLVFNGDIDDPRFDEDPDRQVTAYINLAIQVIVALRVLRFNNDFVDDVWNFAVNKSLNDSLSDFSFDVADYTDSEDAIMQKAVRYLSSTIRENILPHRAKSKKQAD